MKTLTDWLDHCERLHPKSIDMGLDRVRAVAQRMDIRFDCPVITVAGTNGKGSTCAMLEAILGHAGYRTGVYTSPHLVHFEERLRLSGSPVATDQLVDAFERVERARCLSAEPVSLTYFEFSTLAILDVMARTPLDVVVLEVGLGGRLDAVNIVEPDCAVITSIDLDHMELLGKDRESIGNTGGQPSDATFEQWRWQRFTPVELADPAVSGSAADPNGNGRKNMLEYAIGEYPVGEGTGWSGLGRSEVLSDDGNRVNIRWKQRRLAAGLEYRILVSSNLFEWVPAPSTMEVLSKRNLPDGAMEQVDASLPFENDSLFIKLDVIKK
jgi:hypothetical protein